ncbi:hypothetical protein Salat_2674100 [Sesamum alatum]|uniref:Uncharacterized protein n=1 Tax=Sesamum alatum TaxID=300844 RepID=A0AAE2CB53_9LAMI|nr:hypothetical protein Salat_2674100 [Sesamum alatum]
MQSSSFEVIVVKRATNEGFMSFYKCLSQLKLLKALKDGFDPRTISFFKDVEFKDNPPDVIVDSIPEDKFVALVKSAPSHPTFNMAASSVTPPSPSGGPPRLMELFWFPFCIPYPLQNNFLFFPPTYVSQ